MVARSLGLVFVVVSLASQGFASPAVVSGPGVLITEGDLALELQVFPIGRQRQVVADPGLFRELVNTYYRRARMAVVAREEGLDDDPLLQHRMRRAVEDRLVEAAQDAFVATLDDVDFSRMARVRYQADLEQYRVPERVHVRHILLRAGSEGADRREEITILRERALAGESFGFLAQGYSEDDGTRSEGGDLGFFGRGTMVPQFEEAAFALSNPGDVSEPVESQFGWHIIELVAREAEHVRPFDEVRESIESQLRASFVRDELTAWIRDVTNPADANLDEEALERVLGAARQRLGLE